MAGVPWNTIIGGAMDTVGTAIIAGGADKRRKQAMELANTPGIDFTMLARDAMSGYNANYGGAYDLASRLSKDQQAILNAQEESALPGIGAARGEALNRVRGLFADDATYIKGLQRRAGALGLGRGTGGSASTQFAGLKLSDTEQKQNLSLGTSLLGSLIGGMRLANTPGIQQFMGNSLSEQLATRSNERTQRLSMMSAAQGMPTGLETWGQRLQQAGSTLAGSGGGFSGTTSQLGSGWGGGGNSSAAQTNPWGPGGAASNYYGMQDPVGYGYGGGGGGGFDVGMIGRY